MTWSVLIALAVGTVAGLGVSVIYALARRYARGSRELGTDAERATFETLNLASRAATHLRGGLLAGDPARAARYLRVLLNCEVLVIVDERGAIAVDGGSDRVRASAERLAQAARQSGRVELSRAVVQLEHGERDGVAAPIMIRGRSIGAIVAFSRTVRPGLVRATDEVADWVAAQLELADLDASRAALAEAEVRALRAQISPHFIYNALNAIASFITTDPPKARDLVLEFADFTRYSFRRDGDFTTIAEELGSVDSYLKLERARFGDRISVTLQIAPEVLGTVIPFLSVQPLVENAVRHGLESKEGGGHITITAEDSGSYAQITVEDDGVGIDPEVLRDVLAGRPSTGHIGLRNVDSRLRQVYGNAHGLVVETNLDAGTLVTMRVPKSQPDHLAGQDQGR
ncbi:two-component system, LytT family, sensor kinase [Salinibacterium xinjiangense]|uniref:Two-component system, LytT family, sensor kinase n=1 Tax=Salinibacterium xinjiangense TaxID=386302 RepID=A0A2C8ZTG3_9MICO|nr:sensor histidine kinase [Salinibacterium xinjiangense]SOE69002.1 two-component system, LytT family, sensor kinase [Salinibacterium xinjiangense]